MDWLALASAGQYDRALETAAAALALGPPESLAAAIRARLELYRQGKPYASP